MALTRPRLLAAAKALCDAFAAKAETDTLLSHFSTTHQITATEYGEPFFTPFIGRVFTGRKGPQSVPAYFSLLQKHLTYDNMSFGEWVIDTDSKKVSVKGSAKFTWIEGKGEGQAWEEEFVYVLDFDDEGKVTDYQVWADTGAAYLAARGEHAEKMKQFQLEEGDAK